MRAVIGVCLIASAVAASAQLDWLLGKDYFVPSNRVTGIGLGRSELSDITLARRAELMIDSQTFSIMRDPQALAGAQRITSPKLKKIFDQASVVSGLPASFIASIAYLESWGRADVASSAGPKGIMQIAHATAKSMGLQIRYATKYRVVSEKVQVKKKGKKGATTSTRERKVPYTVLVSDERLIPEKAVPAAAKYLARLEARYGGRDWAVWAYHCGEGCAAEVRGIAVKAGLKEPLTVQRVFFGASPARHRELHEVLRHHMERDYSPTYYFRIQRAEQLLKLYEDDPVEFKRLFNEYRYRVNPDQRAPHRLTVWLKPDDCSYRTVEDLRREAGASLAKVFNEPRAFGFTLGPSLGEDDQKNRVFYLQATPATIGTLVYILYETHRLYDSMKVKNEKWVPLEVVSMVRPLSSEQKTVDPKAELPSHCSGQVVDLNLAGVGPGQREALEFVLEDLGYQGYLGFVREPANGSTVHIGAAPAARAFFEKVYLEAADKSGR